MIGRRILILTLCAALAAATASPAQQSGQGARKRGGAETLTTKQIRGNLYQIGGGGGNTFFYVGPEEVLAIDAKTTPDGARAMLAEIKKISPLPLRRLVLTHSDGDHVGGLAGLPEGVTVIAQENARKEIEQANATAANKLPLPAKTFAKDMTLKVGETEFKLLYFGPAHTSGDVVVFIPSEKIAIAGDLIFIGRDPLIHRQKGGNSFGVVAAQKAMVKLDADLYLSGHAEPVDKKTVEGLTAQIEEKQARVKALVKEGKSLEDVKKALGVEGEAGGRRWPSLVEIIYLELTAPPAAPAAR